MKRKKGFFSISAVAKMFSVHQQTIRLYEKEGLISPKRSEGNTRLFSEEDVDRLEKIIYFTHKVGVNLAGVDLILKQQNKINKLQKEINQLFSQMQENLKNESSSYEEEIKKHMEELQEISRKNIIETTEATPSKQSKKAEKSNQKSTNTAKKEEKNEKSDIEDWEIDYND